MMAMTKRRREVSAPSGSLIVWMAGLVMGAGAGIVLVYHMLLASHSVATHRLHASAFARQAPMVATGLKDAPKELNQEHAQALLAAMKPAKS